MHEKKLRTLVRLPTRSAGGCIPQSGGERRAKRGAAAARAALHRGLMPDEGSPPACSTAPPRRQRQPQPRPAAPARAAAPSSPPTAPAPAAAADLKRRILQLAGSKYGHDLDASSRGEVEALCAQLAALGAAAPSVAAGETWRPVYNNSTGNSSGKLGPFITDVDQVRAAGWLVGGDPLDFQQAEEGEGCLFRNRDMLFHLG